ncbi:MAG TPA: MarR family transcriptional regulator, partial [Chitinophagales bacterium]|nr:MarR family transcriptional regulator [Chitinophagales bacterium]
GFVERVVSKKDRRAVDVLITQKGLDVLALIDARDEKTDKPTSHLSQEEAAELNRLLGKVLEALTE